MRIKVTLVLVIWSTLCSANIYFAHDLVDNIKLTQGFETDTSQRTAVCLKPSLAPKYWGGWVLDDVVKNNDYRDVLMQLGLNTGMGPNDTVFNNSMQAQFIQQLSQDQYSQNFIYRTDIVLPSKAYQNPDIQNPLNEIGTNLLSKPQEFRDYCGDQYMNELYYQGMLYIVVQLQFFNANDKTNFPLNNHLDIEGLQQNLAAALGHLNADGLMTLSVLQVGGELTPLKKIWITNTCRFNDIQACLTQLDSLTHYASSRDADDFIEQFPSTKESPVPVTAAVNEFIARDYVSLKIPVTPVPDKLTSEIKGIRIQLDIAYKAILGNLFRAQYILALKNLQPDYQQSMIELSNDLTFNKDLYEKTGQTCFNKLALCEAEYQYALNHAKPVDLSLLDNPVIMPVQGSIKSW